MAEYKVQPKTESEIYHNVVFFQKMPILGFAGKKIDRVLGAVIPSPFVEDPKVPVPVEKKVGEIIGIAPTIEFKAALDFMLGGARFGNPASADLLPGEDPLGATQAEIQRQRKAGLVPEPRVLPMWTADP